MVFYIFYIYATVVHDEKFQSIQWIILWFVDNGTILFYRVDSLLIELGRAILMRFCYFYQSQ